MLPLPEVRDGNLLRQVHVHKPLPVLEDRILVSELREDASRGKPSVEVGLHETAASDGICAGPAAVIPFLALNLLRALR